MFIQKCGTQRVHKGLFMHISAQTLPHFCGHALARTPARLYGQTPGYAIAKAPS